MGMVVKANMQAMNASRYLGIVDVGLAKNTEKLSSGYKINRAADNAAGLAISEKMRRQIKGLTRASENAMDGISFCQIADGACGEVHDILNRMKVLAIQASNDTNSDTDRSYLQEEVSQLTTEIDRVNDTTVFNEINVFCNGEPSYYNMPKPLSPGEKLYPDKAPSEEPFKTEHFEISWEFVGVDGGGSIKHQDSVDSTDKVGSANTHSDMADFIKASVADAAKKLEQAYPSLFSAAATKNIKIGLNMANIDGGGGVLASAAVTLTSGTDTTMTYKLNVDTSDYPVASFSSMTDAQKADLGATIAHEMTHIMMYDTVTGGMLGAGTTGEFPSWFVEGVAQTSSGDGGWMSGQLSAISTDKEIKNYMDQIFTMPYGAGYAAAMVLGSYAGGGVSSSSIRSGLDSILTEVAKGKTLDEAIKSKTSFSGLADFERTFKNGDGDTVSRMKDLLTARGADGAGSILGSSLGTKASDLFKSPSATTNYYNLDETNSAVKNTIKNNAYQPYPAGPNNSAERDEDKPDMSPDELEKYAKKLHSLGKDIAPGILYSSPIDLQVGAEAGQFISLLKFDISGFGLFFNAEYGPHTAWDGTRCDNREFMETPDVSTVATAQRSLAFIDRASEKISAIRSYYGASQNRLEHTIRNLDNVVENTTAAESVIRDTDMAEEMVAFSNNNIIRQAAQTMLAQANQSNQQILSLLG